MPAVSRETDSPEALPLAAIGTQPVGCAEWASLLAIVAAGALLRCWQPSHMAVEHFDEGVYASNLCCPATGNAYPFRHLYAPPLLPALLEWVLIVSGRVPHGVMWVNVLAGCVMLPSVWWAGRQWFGPVAGVSAATLAAFSEPHIFYSRTALTDPLLCLWMLWAVYWAWRAILTGRPAAILLAGVFASLAWWTKYNGWLTLAVSGAGTAAWICLRRLRDDQRRAGDGGPLIAAHPRPNPGRNGNDLRTADAAASESSQSRSPRDRGAVIGRALSVVLCWVAIAALATAGWLPYLFELQTHGGYASVSANHARYFVGPGGWWQGLLRQMANLQYLDSGWTGAGLLLALVPALVLGPPGGRLRSQPAAAWTGGWRLPVIIAGGLIGAAVMALVCGVTAVLAAVSALILLGMLAFSRVRPVSMASADDGTLLASSLLAAWFFGLLVAIPMYHPYPRLALPFLVACWFGFGLALSRIWTDRAGRTAALRPDEAPAGMRRLISIGIVLAAGGCLAIGNGWRGPGWRAPAAWEDRRDLQRIAGEILQVLPTSGDQIVYVLGEPGLFYQLCVAQAGGSARLILPAGDFTTMAAPGEVPVDVGIYAIAGPHAVDGPPSEAVPGWAATRLSLIDEWLYDRSTLVLLDEFSPTTLETADIEPAWIRLYRRDRE